MGMRVRATDQCHNCGDEFANHIYVKDSITQYKCKTPGQESGYGQFPGGDPNKFFPDPECSTSAEFARWQDACAAGKPLARFSGPGFGVGVYVIEYEQFFKPREHDYEEKLEVRFGE